ncbi:MAG: phage terminase large subunit [Pseudomonadota bacterium]
MRNRQYRPSLLVLDDVESQEQVRSEEQREKLRDNFARSMLKAGDARTNVIVVGTVLHYDSLLAQLLDPGQSPGWRSKKYQAIESWSDHSELWDRWEAVFTEREEHESLRGEAGAQSFLTAHIDEMYKGVRVLWPECEPYEQLMKIRIQEGPASFDSEKQNEPLDPAHCQFGQDALTFWDDEFDGEQALLQYLGKKVRFYGAWDPSMGSKGGRGDDSAIVILAKDRENKVWYVLVADLFKHSPDKMIDRIVQYAKMYRFNSFAIEANGFQDLLVKDLRARAMANHVRLGLWKLKNSTDKKGRIEALEPLVRQGRIRFSRKHRQLLEQLRMFPLAAHDDGPDALEMAVRASYRTEPSVRTVGRR